MAQKLADHLRVINLLRVLMHADKTLAHKIGIPRETAGDHHKRRKQARCQPHILRAR